MTIYEQLKEVLRGKEGDLVTSSQMKALLKDQYDTNPSSVILSDYCYNRYNSGIPFTKHLFQYMERNRYQYLGENALYTGLIYHKKIDEKTDCIVGEWINGIKYMQDGSFISQAQIKQLYSYYQNILHYEQHILQTKATELRHLMGRIGEFLCVLQTNGQLALNVNQPGYDVIGSNGRKISVKTTAQTNGFVFINMKTFHLFDDLFISYYHNDEFKTLFFGEKERVLQYCRTYGNTYELDLSKLKKFILKI